jgi:transposase
VDDRSSEIRMLLNDGNTQKHIAELIGCSLSKVAYWCVHGDPDNLDSLSDERMKGNCRKATEEYIKLLLEVKGLSSRRSLKNICK